MYALRKHDKQENLQENRTANSHIVEDLDAILCSTSETLRQFTFETLKPPKQVKLSLWKPCENDICLLTFFPLFYGHFVLLKANPYDEANYCLVALSLVLWAFWLLNGLSGA